MALPSIVLTNDDGFDSPGLWRIAEELQKFSEVWITAPSRQFTGAGRCYFRECNGVIENRNGKIQSERIHAFAINCTPAQSVFHAINEIVPTRPDLIISGINYGENLGNIVTGSGTLGATFEAASFGVKSLAVSQEIDPADDYRAYSDKIDFSNAAIFGSKIAKTVIEKGFPQNVDIIKIDVPIHSDLKQWRVTRLSRTSGNIPHLEKRKTNEPATLTWYPDFDRDKIEKDSDIYCIFVDKMISVTPMTIDMTAPVNFPELKQSLE